MKARPSTDSLMQLLALIGALVISVPSQVQAQAADDSSPTGVLEEVIVTAQKRDERLIDVPMGISVLTDKSLAELGAEGISDWARTVPSLQFVDGGFEALQKVSIRGISDGAFPGFAESTVGIYIDEVAIPGFSSFFDAETFDIAQISVLRGPQGTLYGSASMGGTIKIETAKPVMGQFASQVRGAASYTDGGSGNYYANAMLNVPVTDDNLAVRIVGNYRDLSGFIDNVGTGEKNVNDERTSSARISARYETSDKLNVTAMFYYQDQELGGTSGFNPTRGDLVQYRRVPEPQNFESYLGSLTFDYDMGFADLVAVSAYFHREFDSVFDFSTFFSPIMSGIAFSIFGTFIPFPDPSYQLSYTERESFSQEVRLVSNDDGPLQWLAGVYYSTEDGAADSSIVQEGAGNVFGLIGFPSDEIQTSQNVLKVDEIALYGDVTWNFSNQWAASVGLRWFDVSIKRNLVNGGLLNFGTVTAKENASESKFNPRVALKYYASEQSMFYAQAAQGYRVGGVNLAIPPDPVTGPAPLSYESDSVWNYELGSKNQLMDNRLALNAALFYIKWSDMQQTVAQSNGFGYVTNLGEAHSAGIELDVVAVPVDGLQLTASAAYTDAEMDEDIPAAIPIRSGDDLPGVAPFTFAASAQYNFPFRGTQEARLRADYQYVGKSYNTFNSNSPIYQPIGDYGIFSISAGLLADRWQCILYVDNLTDERPVLLTFGGPPAEFGEYITLRPRTIGVNLVMSF